ncbi:GntR family transcriptional regulator [Kineococcus sp. SYSU DK005]|uniref:GntR family transcriptional regulator n=1 Tax=Kineococcus sp. SYSU DK005 TaxID=3383126 RepID=UPI003D7CE88A
MPVPAAQGVHRRDLLRDRVYASLRDAIVEGTLAPGEQLRDADLEAWLGVSRTPIREALQRLEQVGLVTTRPGRSTSVTPIDSETTRHAQQVAAGLQELAVRLAVPRMGEQDLAAMRGANERFAAALDAQDTVAALSADDDFHAVALRAAGNPLLRAHFAQVSPVLRRVELRRFGSGAGRASVEQHERVLAACAAGDVETAARAVRENWHSLQEP